MTSPPTGYVNLIVKRPLTPRDHSLWTKIRVLLHHFESPADGGLFCEDDHGTAVNEPNPASTSPVTPEMWLSLAYVEPAIYTYMAMTSEVTVLFGRNHGTIMFTEQATLDTGRLLLCDLHSNGKIDVSARVWPMFAEEIDTFVAGKAWTARRLIFEKTMARCPRCTSPVIFRTWATLRLP